MSDATVSPLLEDLGTLIAWSDAASVPPSDWFARDGYLLVRDALPAGFWAPVREALVGLLVEDGVVEVDQLGVPRWTGRLEQRPFELQMLPAVSQLVDDPVRRAPLQQLADQLFGGPACLSRHVGVMASLPTGLPATPVHQDGIGWPPDGEYRRFWLPLTEIPAGDGGLAVAPGSHRAGMRTTRPIPPTHVPEGLVTTSFAPGDALLLASALVHATVPYTSDRVRLALAINVCDARAPIPGHWVARSDEADVRAQVARWDTPTEEDLRTWSTPTRELFERARAQVPAQSRSAQILRGLEGHAWPRPNRLHGGCDMPYKLLSGLHDRVLAEDVRWEDALGLLDPLDDELVAFVRDHHVPPDDLLLAPLVAAALLEVAADSVELIEFDSRTGLLLRLDAFAYAFPGQRVGDGQVTLTPPDGFALPELSRPRWPHIVRRRGVGWEPLDIADPKQVRRLLAFESPDRPEKLASLRAALDSAVSTPVEMLVGDPVRLLREALSDATSDHCVVISAGSLVAQSDARVTEVMELLAATAAEGRLVDLISLEPPRFDAAGRATHVERFESLELSLVSWPRGRGRSLGSLPARPRAIGD